MLSPINTPIRKFHVGYCALGDTQKLSRSCPHLQVGFAALFMILVVSIDWGVRYCIRYTPVSYRCFPVVTVGRRQSYRS